MEASTKLLNDIQAKTGRSVVLVGDFNFDPEREDNERVLTENGFRDIMYDFVEKDAFSMHKTPRFLPWRPDKITISV
jgi:endonuclease/exonuclease/phosphatase family metal-dependent hydrolase